MAQIAVLVRQRRAAAVGRSLGIPEAALERLSRYDGVIERLQEVGLGLCEIYHDEPLETLDLYGNGVFLIGMELKTGAFLDALPPGNFQMEMVELHGNGKPLLVATAKDGVVWQRIPAHWWELLCSTKLWQAITAV
ncbi:MAG: hypothetical protein NZ482_01870 [Gloeomargarita sp. SKYG98]|nr:hypothetical protein [Gloeomargarita sp. SKYG98]